MPTPYGYRGAMAFSADDLRVLRRALALALRTAPVPAPLPGRSGPARAEEVRELRRLAERLDEARQEGCRLRAFLRAEVARYRAALPGAAAGYLERLEEAVDAGYAPGAPDLAALRSLCADPALSTAEAGRRSALLRRCEALGGHAEGEQPPGGGTPAAVPPPALPVTSAQPVTPAPAVTPAV